MVVSQGHQLMRVDIEAEDENANEENNEARPASAITTHTESTELGNDMLTFQSREEELSDSMFTMRNLNIHDRHHFLITLLCKPAS